MATENKYSSLPLFDSKIDDLASIVEEGARADAKNTNRFIEPGLGTLRRAKNKRHQLIFGRRGSGKSSLIFKTAEELSNQNLPIVIVDLERFKGHQYPDIILSVLIATFNSLLLWIKDHILKHHKLVLKSFFIKSEERKNLEKLSKEIEAIINSLNEQLHLTDLAKLTQSNTNSKKSIQKSNKKGTVNIDSLSTGFEGGKEKITENLGASQISEEYKRSKKDFLVRNILTYQEIFKKLNSIIGNDTYLFFDDLYHILRGDQASLIDYFHRIVKGNSAWLKIGTIKHRTSWYIHDPQPIGLKIGDDADEIDLDITLEKFRSSKEFLRKVLDIYVTESNCPNIDSFMVDGALDRLVLSSGGVARDFLGLFRKAIDEAKERLRNPSKKAKRTKIGAEDVNLASGDYGELKKEEFQRDTLEDRQELEEAFEKIKFFCLNKIKKNIFLVSQDLNDNNGKLIDELIDLRLIHQVKSRVTVTNLPGKVFRAYLLDVSQYTGERARRDVEMVDFWKDNNKDRIRLRSLIYNPQVSLEELETESVKRTNKITPIYKKETDDPSLFDELDNEPI